MRASFRQRMMAHPRVGAALLATAVGVLILLFSAVGIYPAQALARLFSDDGVLSAAYVRLIQSGQIKLGVALLLAVAWAGWVDVRRVIRFVRELPFWKAALGAGLVAFLLSFAVQEWVFEGIPHVTDATSHLFQARIFNEGRLYVPAPPCPDAFWQPNVITTTSGKWFTKYTPGHALMLAAGMRLGLLAWILPLCLAATIVLLGRLLDDQAGKIEARVFMLMFALSPLALLLGGSYMSHTTALAGAAAGLFCWMKSRTAARPVRVGLWRVAAGFFLAFSALTRPSEFVLAGLIGGIFFLGLSRAEWRWLGRSLPLLIVGALPVIAFWLLWNQMLYGNPLAIGYGFTTVDVHRASFQGHFGFSPSFGWRAATSQLVATLDRFNRAFLGFPISLLLVPLAFLGGRRRLTGLAVTGVAVVVGFYFFYEYRQEYEARYYYLALPFFLYLAAAGLRNGARWGAGHPWDNFVRQAVWLGVVAGYFHSAGAYWPDYLLPNYAQGYEECSVALPRLVTERGVTDAVVLVTPADAFAYSSGFIRNDPLLRNDVVYARGDPRVVDCLRAAFPDKALYRYDAHTAELAPWR